MFHCCMSAEELENHCNSCYASVLMFGKGRKMRLKMRQLENEGLHPFLTGWCHTHHRFSVIYCDPEQCFSKPSAYYAHVLAVQQNLELPQKNKI